MSGPTAGSPLINNGDSTASGLRLPPRFALEQLMFGFLNSQILFTLHQAGVFQALQHGPLSPKQLSERLTPTSVPPESLRRLLIGGVTIELFTYQPESDEFSLRPEWIPYLCQGHAEYSGEKFGHYFKYSYQLAEHMEAALKENKPQWDKFIHPQTTDSESSKKDDNQQKAAVAPSDTKTTCTCDCKCNSNSSSATSAPTNTTVGLSLNTSTSTQVQSAVGTESASVTSSDSNNGTIYDEYVYTSPAATANFLETMWASGYEDSKSLADQLSATDLITTQHKVMIDLGGATGSFIIPMLVQYPHLRGVVMDYSCVQPYAVAKFNEMGLSDRASFLSGNFFDDPLPPADVFVIGYVLSDWSELKSRRLVQKAYDALTSGGLLMILEKVFEEDYSGPYLTAMLNVVMLLEMEGTHKTAKQYCQLLTEIGCQEIRFIKSKGEKHMILGRKP